MIVIRIRGIDKWNDLISCRFLSLGSCFFLKLESLVYMYWKWFMCNAVKSIVFTYRSSKNWHVLKMVLVQCSQVHCFHLTKFSDKIYCNYQNPGKLFWKSPNVDIGRWWYRHVHKFAPRNYLELVSRNKYDWDMETKYGTFIFWWYQNMQLMDGALWLNNFFSPELKCFTHWLQLEVKIKTNLSHQHKLVLSVWLCFG